MSQLHPPKTANEQFIFNGLTELGIRGNDIEFQGNEHRIIRIGYWRPIPNFEQITWLHEFVYEAQFFDDDCGWLTLYQFRTPDNKDLLSIRF